MSNNLYSENYVENSSCENKNLIGWDYQNVTAKSGGQDGTWYFELNSTAFMEQSILAATINGTPPNFRLTTAFKLLQTQDPIDTNVKAYVTLTVEYKDDTFDVFIIPYIGNIQYANNIQNNWILIQQDCIVQNKELEVVKVRIDTENITGGLAIDYITVQKDTGIDQYSTEVINQQLPSMIYYTNPSQITVSTTETQPVYLGTTTLHSSNLSIALAIYGVATQDSTLTMSIQLDATDIPFSPLKQKVSAGDFIIGIPFTIPQVAQGAHYLGIKLKVDVGGITIATNMLQLTVDGRYLAGGLNPDLPHAEARCEIYYINVNPSLVSESITTFIDLPISRTIWEYILFNELNNNKCRISNVSASLTQTAEESTFIESEASDWDENTTFVVLDGALYQKNIYDINMSSTTLGSGTMYTGQMIDTADISIIGKVEVE